MQKQTYHYKQRIYPKKVKNQNPIISATSAWRVSALRRIVFTGDKTLNLYSISALSKILFTKDYIEFIFNNYWPSTKKAVLS